jgi:hypothetical protein
MNARRWLAMHDKDEETNRPRYGHESLRERGPEEGGSDPEEGAGALLAATRCLTAAGAQIASRPHPCG